MAIHRDIPDPIEYPDPTTSDHITYNPSFEKLKRLSEEFETVTEYGSPSYVSEYRSRSSKNTKNALDDVFNQDDIEVFQHGLEWVHDSSNDIICLDRIVGHHEATSFVCRLYLPAKYGRIALSWAKLLEPVSDEHIDFLTVQQPDLTSTPKIRISPEKGTTTVLGSDYTGEAKKSFLRLFMHQVKQHGGLGLHAGSKRVTLNDEKGPRDVGQVFLGLSGTGKSTLTSHGLWLEEPEGVEMIQDDVCALLPSGTVAGSEGGGLYIKTLGLDTNEQPGLYRAATKDTAVLENVAVDDDGTVDFDDPRYGRNARAAIQRSQLENSAENIDLDFIDQIFFITRNPLMPPISRLSTDQAAVAFMLGESIETSAGDPSRIGEPIRVVGTNPFIMGDKGEEGNRFRDLINNLGIDCYVINTGSVGIDEPIDIGVKETVSILESVTRGNIEWTYSAKLGLTVPSNIPELDIEAVSVPDRVDDFETAQNELRENRREFLNEFNSLDEQIIDAIY